MPVSSRGEEVEGVPIKHTMSFGGGGQTIRRIEPVNGACDHSACLPRYRCHDKNTCISTRSQICHNDVGCHRAGARRTAHHRPGTSSGGGGGVLSSPCSAVARRRPHIFFQMRLVWSLPWRKLRLILSLFGLSRPVELLAQHTAGMVCRSTAPPGLVPGPPSFVHPMRDK